jgi:SAM-dependent MidA family methyltransferase
MMVAHEFFDALPIHVNQKVQVSEDQLAKGDDGWREVLVDRDDNNSK